MEKLWLVIPTYNERNNLGELITRLLVLPLPLTVLVVDDASPDGTADLAEEIIRQHQDRVYLLRRPAKLGLGGAYREGFAFVLAQGATVVGQMDADLSHLPEDLPKLWQAIKNGAGVAVGSRRAKGGKIVGWSAWRHLSSWGANTISRLILGLKTQDVTAGFRLYQVAALQKIPWRQIRSNGYAWQEEVLCLLERAGVKAVEVPVVFNDRAKGKSKLRFGDIVEFFLTIFRLKRRGK